MSLLLPRKSLKYLLHDCTYTGVMFVRIITCNTSTIMLEEYWKHNVRCLYSPCKNYITSHLDPKLKQKQHPLNLHWQLRFRMVNPLKAGSNELFSWYFTTKTCKKQLPYTKPWLACFCLSSVFFKMVFKNSCFSLSEGSGRQKGMWMIFLKYSYLPVKGNHINSSTHTSSYSNYFSQYPLTFACE